jgi:hypothetical protein
MIFWILLALSILVAVVVWRVNYLDGAEIGEATAFSACGLILAATASAIIFFAGFSWWIYFPAEIKSENTYSLQAIDAGDSIHGRSYFLGGGYIDGNRVVNYIRDNGSGGYLVKSVDGDDAVIYQDTKSGSSDATVIIREYDYINPWVLPWPIGDTFTAEFHVPYGSIIEDYQIEN